MGTRVLIADDHPLFREALELAILRLWNDAEVVHACTLAEGMATLSAQEFSLVLLDLNMCDCSGVQALLTVRSQFPRQAVAIISADEDHHQIRTALALGAAGYIPKSCSLPGLGHALNRIMAGECWTPPLAMAASNPEDRGLGALTPAQLRILLDLQRGRLNKQIAFDTGVTEATVKAHLTAIFRKLGVANRTQAVLAIQSLRPAAA